MRLNERYTTGQRQSTRVGWILLLIVFGCVAASSQQPPLTPGVMTIDPATRKRFGIAASEGILLVDSGENEYEANFYFWTGNGYRHEWLDR